jgi:hypothetical protein
MLRIMVVKMTIRKVVNRTRWIERFVSFEGLFSNLFLAFTKQKILMSVCPVN